MPTPNDFMQALYEAQMRDQSVPSPEFSRPNVDLGLIQILKNLPKGDVPMVPDNPYTYQGSPISTPSYEQPIETPAPRQMSPPGIMPAQQPQEGSGNFMKLLLALGLPAVSTAIGLASPKMLPGAAGFNTGYAGGYGEAQRQQKEQQLEEMKIGRTLTQNQQKLEKEKWDDSYATAIQLSKTGLMGGMAEITPQQLDQKAKEVYEIRYGKKSTTDIPKVQTGKQESQETTSVGKYKGFQFK